MIIKRIVLSVCVAVLVFLLCLLVGGLLLLLGGLFPAFGVFLSFIGNFLIKWAVAIAAIFGVMAFLSGRTSLGFWPWV